MESYQPNQPQQDQAVPYYKKTRNNNDGIPIFDNPVNILDNPVQYRLNLFNKRLEALVIDVLCETRGGMGHASCIYLMDHLKKVTSVHIREYQAKYHNK